MSTRATRSSRSTQPLWHRDVAIASSRRPKTRRQTKCPMLLRRRAPPPRLPLLRRPVVARVYLWSSTRLRRRYLKNHPRNDNGVLGIVLKFRIPTAVSAASTSASSACGCKMAKHATRAKVIVRGALSRAMSPNWRMILTYVAFISHFVSLIDLLWS